ncbi:hypothetical protein H1P_60062 [Hyella patelloides LEGE 07179]|uniref:Uncharacterized protein n=1 Tax=Hyella patelloides LEGE 07179 TaxID=945734 RepID=A0A563W168_9CYAN|nr:hypothetical protein H1P_60062 [Hyella patelloides LEGE 07179]
MNSPVNSAVKNCELILANKSDYTSDWYLLTHLVKAIAIQERLFITICLINLF